MAAPLKFSVLIKGIDALSAPMRRASNSLDRDMRRSLTSTTAAAKRFNDGIFNAGIKVAAFGATSAAVAAGGLARLTLSTAERGDELAKFSRQVGVSAEALQELQFASDRSGLGVDKFNLGIKTFARNLGQAKAGFGPLTEGLKRISPALLEQLKTTTSTEQAFEIYVAALNRVPDASRKAALAAVAFGEEGAAITRVAEGGVAGLRALRQEARDLGGIISTKDANASEALVDSLTNAKRAIAGVGVELAVSLGPPLKGVLDGITAWVKANKALIKQRLGDIVGRIADALRSVDWRAVAIDVGRFARAAADLFEQLGGVKTILTVFAVSVVGKVIAGIATLVSAISTLAGAWTAASTAVAAATGVALGPIVLAIATLAAVGAAIYTVAQDWDFLATVTKQAWRALQKATADALGYMRGKLEQLGGMVLGVGARITGALSSLWSGFTSAANRAIDAVTGRLRAVLDTLRRAGQAIGLLDEDSAPGPGASSLGAAPVTAQLAAQQSVSVGGRVDVRFRGAPSGTSVASQGRGGLELTTDLGVRPMLAGGL